MVRAACYTAEQTLTRLDNDSQFEIRKLQLEKEREYFEAEM